MKMTGLLPYFEVVLSGDDFEESKPNPEIYQVAMAKLGVGAGGEFGHRRQ
jgi:beta-phosphoglucomutase